MSADRLAERRAELARRLASLSADQRAHLDAAAPAPAPPTITPRDPSAPVPLTFAQEMLFGLERANPGQAYHVPRAVRLTGPLDRAALGRALDALVARHEALRTTLALGGTEACQVIHTAAPVPVTERDLSHLPVEEREGRARAELSTLAAVPFDLERDAQLRVALVRLGPEDHVLQLLSHHVASDGWSGNVLLRELSALYDGFRAGRDVALPPLPVSYADFAAWQRRTLTGAHLERLLAFWRPYLAGAVPRLELPTERPASAAPGTAGAVRGTVLPRAVVDGVQALARAEGMTSFMVCLTALFTLLYRYAGEEELVVGTPVAGRPFPELEGIVGFFANTILLRASMGGQPSFRSLLRHVRTNCLAAFDHQEVPLESLLLSTTPDGRPLAVVPQVVFSMEDPDKAAFALAGTAARPMAAALGGSKFDLHLWAAERAEGLRLSLEYRTALYDEGSVTRFLSHFGALLAGAVAEPDAPISALPLMDDAERTQVVRTWNATAVDYPAGDTLVSLLEAQAARTPDAPAVRDARTTLSYAQLHAAADALAARLRAAGAGAGTRVGICAERSVELVVALVATLKAGAAYVPFDPEYPRDRLAFMVADAAVAVVIAPAAFVPLVASGAGAPPVVALEGVAEPASAGARTWPAPTPDDAAYMIYTSGSTGRPKGAVNAHRHIVNRLRWMQATFQLTERDVVLQKTPMSFDVSVWEFFWPLLAGARLVLAAPGGHRDPAYLADVIRTEQVSVLHFVPSMLRAFLAAGVAPAAGRTLRAIMASGEALPADLVAQCQAALPQAAVHNLYGPTECAVDVTWWPCPPGLAPSAVVPIGRPIANTQCYVLDAHGAPCPIGVPGELYLAGAQVGLGYHGRAELTAERFVADPFAAARGARMYRTGDRARWRADGTIEYLGRLDFQVKLRGFRIELGEIEAALQGAGGVRESVVVMHGSGADARLVAYVVPSGPGTADPARLAAALGGTLPAYMVPAVIMPLDAMPLTPSGKVDRRALPAPKAAATARRYVAPRTTIEHELAQCWEAIVQPGHPVSAFDDFFEIGGNSLLAIRMLAQVERLRGQRVPLAWLLEGPTVAALATRLAAPMHDAAEPPLVTLNPEGTGRPLAWVHGDWTGGGWYLRRLAPLVVPDAPVHVFPTLGQEDDDAPWTIEAMAARHVGELRKVQPNGPYTVVGFCVGGVVAFEMARQLREAGETVDRLVVIDSDPMNGRLGRLRPLRQLVEALPASSEAARLDRAAAFLSAVRWVHRRILYYQSLPAHERRAWLTGKVTRRLPWNRPVAARPAASAPATPSPAPATPAGATPDDDAIVLRSQGRATAVYIPGRWDGALDFVWAEGAPGKARRVNPVERWRRVAREVHLHRVPSGHIGLITNNLALLADALRALVGRR